MRERERDFNDGLDLMWGGSICLLKEIDFKIYDFIISYILTKNFVLKKSCCMHGLQKWVGFFLVVFLFAGAVMICTSLICFSFQIFLMKCSFI